MAFGALSNRVGGWRRGQVAKRPFWNADCGLRDRKWNNIKLKGGECVVELFHGGGGQLVSLDEPDNGFPIKFQMVDGQTSNATEGFSGVGSFHKLSETENGKEVVLRGETVVGQVVANSLALKVHRPENRFRRQLCNHF
jgi:hypothetical protein